MNHKSLFSEMTLSQKCYQELENNIINGTLPPGKKLKVEELKTLLGVGQSPIREALSRLASSGLVDSQDNKGFRVTRFSEDDIQDIYRTFLQIELLALSQAIDRGDLNWQATIVAALYQLEHVETSKKPISYEDWTIHNYNFHVALISGCQSPTLLQIRADLYKRFDRYCRISFNIQNTHRQLIANHQEHKELAEAVLNRDLKKTTTLMTHHIMGSLDDVMQSLKKNNLL